MHEPNIEHTAAAKPIIFDCDDDDDDNDSKNIQSPKQNDYRRGLRCNCGVFRFGDTIFH